MIEIIQHGGMERGRNYSRSFSTGDGSGYSFPCSVNGTLEPFTCPEAAASWVRCQQGVAAGCMTDKGILSWEYRTKWPTIGRCTCGREVVLDRFTCSCDCGLDYNQSGQLLAPRSQWGEETGESLGDILRVR